MNSVKTLVRNKEWLIRDSQHKIGSVAKAKKGYVFLRKGKQINFQNLSEIKIQFGISAFDENTKNIKEPVDTNYSIYNYPCRSKPYDPVYSVKKKLPLFAKSPKSKSQYCAGYYIVYRKNGWAASFCPKLITIERYQYQGPFKTEAEMKSVLSEMNKE